nr:hypothetical protein [Streptomyces sp. SID5468]
MGQHTRPWTPEYGHWARPPTADYRCAACGFTDSAVGDAVRAFAATIHRIHTTSCLARSTN